VTDTNRQRLRIIIDLSRCGGHARCMAEAPSVFGYDDRTNRAYILDDADLGSSRNAIERAILSCPELAISWGPQEGK